jgi:hypothetical protein
MSKPNSQILACLKAAEQAHQQTTADGKNSDPDWAGWYARYLLQLTDFSRHTSRQWQAEELAEALQHLEAAYQNGSQNQPWTVYTAARLNL